MKFYKVLLISCLLSTSAYAADLTRPILPNDQLTPGVAAKDVGIEQLCVVGYSGTVRNVSSHTKKQVFTQYGINPNHDKYEIDHLISLEIGGTNDVKNLWPQSYTTTPWNAHVKDKLENKLHKQICDGIITVEDAQKKISTDWIGTYCDIYTDMKTECDAYKTIIKE